MHCRSGTSHNEAKINLGFSSDIIGGAGATNERAS
jgi:hypothetical protein